MHEDFLDDNIVIPDDIKKMSTEELDCEIAKLEAEVKAKKVTNQKK